MEGYTLSLALFDYLPVLAGGAAIYLVCRYCAGLARHGGPWVALIPLIALAGGGFKATWKLILAAQGINLQWMSDLLFFFLVGAYVPMAVLVVRSLRAARHGARLAAGWWRAPALLAAAAAGGAYFLKTTADGRAWSALLIAVVALASLTMLLALIGHAFARGHRLAAGAFAASLVLSYVLVGMSRMEQTAQLQWIEQSVNLAGNLLLAAGAWRLIERPASHA